MNSIYTLRYSWIDNNLNDRDNYTSTESSSLFLCFNSQFVYWQVNALISQLILPTFLINIYMRICYDYSKYSEMSDSICFYPKSKLNVLLSLHLQSTRIHLNTNFNRKCFVGKLESTLHKPNARSLDQLKITQWRIRCVLY